MLSGPGGGDWTIACTPNETAGAVPDVLLRAPLFEFCLRFADRLVVDAVPFEVDGDADLGRALVDCRARVRRAVAVELAAASPAAGASPSVWPATLFASICFSISAISATFASIWAAASSGASLRFCATTSAPISWQRSLIFFWRRVSSSFSLPTAVACFA